MRFFVIPPLSHLELMEEGTAGYFVLAHLYAKDPRYRDFLKFEKQRSKFVLLDNGAAENSLVTEEVLIRVVKELNPDEVIAPDVLFDASQTMYNLQSFVEAMQRENLSSNILFCPQGRTKQEWIQCYKFGLNHPEVSTIGLSKIAVPWAWMGARGDKAIMESRHECVDYLEENDLIKKPIHLLGAGNPDEFRYYKHPLIRSTDSCFAVWAGMNEIDWNKGNKSRIPTPHDYFQKNITVNQYSTVLSNIDYLRENI